MELTPLELSYFWPMFLLKGLNPNPELCKTDLSIKCKHVLNITLQGLTMGYTGGTFNSILTLLASSALTLHAIFEDSKTRAIYVNNSITRLEDCTFKRNSPTERHSIGGALFIVTSSTVMISNCHFTENSAQTSGAVLVSRSKLSISKSTFVNNSALEAGGIGCSQCFLYTSFVKLIGNSASDHLRGGAIVVKNAKAFFSNTEVLRNSGTAIRFFRSNIKFTGRSIFKENINSREASGAIESDMSTISFIGNTTFEDNYACDDGGAISGIKRGMLTFEGVTRFSNNTSYLGIGGAISIAIHTGLEMHGSVLFEKNDCIKKMIVLKTMVEQWGGHTMTAKS